MDLTEMFKENNELARKSTCKNIVESYILLSTSIVEIEVLMDQIEDKESELYLMLENCNLVSRMSLDYQYSIMSESERRQVESSLNKLDLLKVKNKYSIKIDLNGKDV